MVSHFPLPWLVMEELLALPKLHVTQDNWNFDCGLQLINITCYNR